MIRVLTGSNVADIPVILIEVNTIWQDFRSIYGKTDARPDIYELGRYAEADDAAAVFHEMVVAVNYRLNSVFNMKKI